MHSNGMAVVQAGPGSRRAAGGTRPSKLRNTSRSCARRPAWRSQAASGLKIPRPTGSMGGIAFAGAVEARQVADVRQAASRLDACTRCGYLPEAASLPRRSARGIAARADLEGATTLVKAQA